MQWSSTDTVEEVYHARGPTEFFERCHATFESESLPKICAPVPHAKGWVLFESACKEKNSETSDEAGRCRCRSPHVVSGRRHHRLHVLVDHLMCRDGRSDQSKELPRFHGFLKGWGQFTLAGTRRAMLAPLSEALQQFNVLNHPHMAAFILVIHTRLRPSESLVLNFSHVGRSKRIVAGLFRLRLQVPGVL